MLLLKVGQKVEAILQNQTTPNETKLEGFGNLLQSEWKKQAQHNGSGVESVRSLTMMYSKLQREGIFFQSKSSTLKYRGLKHAENS